MKAITLTDREIKALQNIVDQYLATERKDCEQYMIESGIWSILDENTIDPDDGEKHDHIYDDLKIISKLLEKLK